MKESSFLRRHPVAAYYLLALAWMWLVEWQLVAVKQGWTTLKIPFAIHYLASLGPAAAAILVTAAVTGRCGLRELWSRMVRWRVRLMWAIVAVLSPLLLFAGSLFVVRVVKGAWPDIGLLGQPNFLLNRGPGVLNLWLASFGFGVEIGWRGFAFPVFKRQ